MENAPEYQSYLEIDSTWSEPSVEGYHNVWQVYDFAKANYPVPRIGETITVAKRSYIVTAVVHEYTNVKQPFLKVRVLTIPVDQLPKE